MAARTTLDRLVRVRAATRRTAIAAATDDSSTASDSPLARAPGSAYRQWGIRHDCSRTWSSAVSALRRPVGVASSSAWSSGW